MTKSKLTVQCGDWHLGWGYGGHDKIGKLTLDPLNNSFIWKGSSQGRHGQKWNKGAQVVFTYEQKVSAPMVDTPIPPVFTIIHQTGGIPERSELIKGCEEILANQLLPPPKKRVIKTKGPELF